MHYDSRTDGDFDDWLKKRQDFFEEMRIYNHNKSVLVGVVLMMTCMSLLGAAVGYFVLK